MVKKYKYTNSVIWSSKYYAIHPQLLVYVHAMCTRFFSPPPLKKGLGMRLQLQEMEEGGLSLPAGPA